MFNKYNPPLSGQRGKERGTDLTASRTIVTCIHPIAVDGFAKLSDGFNHDLP